MTLNSEFAQRNSLVSAERRRMSNACTHSHYHELLCVCWGCKSRVILTKFPFSFRASLACAPTVCPPHPTYSSQFTPCQQQQQCLAVSSTDSGRKGIQQFKDEHIHSIKFNGQTRRDFAFTSRHCCSPLTTLTLQNNQMRNG